MAQYVLGNQKRAEGRGCALLPRFGGGSLLPDVLTRQPSRR
jgi:hypothetical protein